MAKSPTEGIPSTEAVDNLHRKGLHFNALGSRFCHYSFGAAFDNSNRDASLQERIGSAVGIGLTHGNFTFFAVTDSHRGLLQGFLHLLGGISG